jgi:Cu/Ag efflux pump CusA
VIGLVVLIVLATKKAILIVEFDKEREDAGLGRVEAAVQAAKMRLRLILMTSFAFILGVMPLVLAKGAGAEMRCTFGLAVFGGMLGVTLFAIFITPVSYGVIRWLTGRGKVAPLPTLVPEGADGHPEQDGTPRRVAFGWPGPPARRRLRG